MAAAQRRRRRGSPIGCATPCAEHFAAVRAHLDALGVPYRLEPGLVRGLDYYTRTAFEFYSTGREGQQQALGGGGRYDGLVELLGGRPTPGIGFGIGLDRLVLALAEQGAARRRRQAGAGGGRGRGRPGRHRRTAADRHGAARAGIAARAELGHRKLGKQLEAAARDQAHFAVIVGDELAGGEVQLKDLPAGTQKLVALDDLAREVARRARRPHRADGSMWHGGRRAARSGSLASEAAVSPSVRHSPSHVVETLVAPLRACDGDSLLQISRMIELAPRRRVDRLPRRCGSCRIGSSRPRHRRRTRARWSVTAGWTRVTAAAPSPRVTALPVATGTIRRP